MTLKQAWVEHALEQMTMSEKIGQMTQVSNDSITPAEVADHAIGSVLSGGNGNPSPNTPQVWADMVGSFTEAAAGSRCGIPLIYGVDAVHGHSNVRGATVYPHNIGLGAAGDADLVRRIGQATATEMLATGVRWAFSPCVAVPQDIRWGRTYEGFGRDPGLVSSLGAALVEGLQHDADGAAAVLACPKHFVGDGGTTWDSVGNPPWTSWWDPWGDEWRIDQGDLRAPEEELRTVHLPPYEAAVAAGALSVMASYSSWNGAKLHGHRYLLTEILKNELAFPGFVISDWMGVDQIDPDYRRSVVAAINAGVDMVMVPIDWRQFIAAMEVAVADGDTSSIRVGRSWCRTSWIGPTPSSPPGFPGRRPLSSPDCCSATTSLKAPYRNHGPTRRPISAIRMRCPVIPSVTGSGSRTPPTHGVGKAFRRLSKKEKRKMSEESR